MGASVEAVDGGVLLKFNNFLVEEGGNEISVSQNFIYEFPENVGEGHRSNRGKAVMDLSTGEVPATSATGNSILLDSDIILESDGKIGCSILYLILTLMLGMGHEKPWVLL